VKKHPIYKIGTLVFCGDTSSNGSKGYGIVVDIVDRMTGEHYNEKKIITGHGDRNTKVRIHVKILCHAGTDTWASSEKLTFLDFPIVRDFDPHHVFKISKEACEKRYENDLRNMNIKLDFIKKYSLTRDEKIDKIIT
jgi:hypothetical protein